jgi:hypothetical protein
MPHLTRRGILFNTNALNIATLRGASRRSNLVFYDEIATLPSVARNDNVTIHSAFVLITE